MLTMYVGRKLDRVIGQLMAKMGIHCYDKDWKLF